MTERKKPSPGRFVPWDHFDELFSNMREEHNTRHTENLGRFAKIDDKVEHLQNVMDEHIATDARSFADVRLAINENTEVTKEGATAAEATKESVQGLVAIYEAGEGIWSFGKKLRTFALVVFGIFAGFTGAYLTLLYWLGRGPLPPLH